MTVQGSYTQLFANASQAAAYALHRPTYPQALYDHIFNALGLAAGAKLPLAVDVATGTGQALLGLVDRFDKIVGVDASLEQIKEAPKLPNVSYLAGDAHSLPLEPGSADLITVGQALHWFDRPVFYRSAAQALQRGTGVLAVMTYDAGHVQPEGGPVDSVYQNMFRGVLDEHWAPPIKLVNDLYENIEPMAPGFFERQERHQVPQGRQVALEDLLGFARSWSAYQTYRKKHPELEDPLVGFRQRLQEAAKEQGVAQDARLEIVYTYTLLLGVGPKDVASA